MANIFLSHELEPWINPIDGKADYSPGLGRMETYTCPCGKNHEVLYLVKRRIIDTLGHFPRVRLNGEIWAIDATLPTSVTRIPRDAIKIPEDKASRLWHGTGHYFGEEYFSQEVTP